jgi:hypothetical protein
MSPFYYLDKRRHINNQKHINIQLPLISRLDHCRTILGLLEYKVKTFKKSG